MSSQRLAIQNLYKSYAVPVLKDVNLEVGEGEIHALVGENGAGKSTLLNVLTGLTARDSGEIQLDGVPYDAANASAAFAAGISLASQELSIIDSLSVAENVGLRDLPRQRGIIDRAALHALAAENLTHVGLGDVGADLDAGSLSLADKQLLEIARALSASPRLLLLDEPTAALTDDQADRVHDIIRDRAGAGMSIIYISHRLNDVLDVADNVSVLRDGRIVATGPTSEYSTDDLVSLMAGEPFEAVASLRETAENGSTLIRADDVTTRDLPIPISLTAAAGEIVGLAGLAGAGRSELLHAMFGLVPLVTGSVARFTENGEQPIDSAATAVRSGLAMLGEDRQSMGLFNGLSVSTNMMTPGQRQKLLSTIRREDEASRAAELIDRLGVDCRGGDQDIAELSGGNQQKALIGRWLNAGSDVFLLDEPTRGVDVGTKHALYALFRELADGGSALVIASSELEELMAVCDRIVVLSDRRIAAEMDRPAFSEEAILNAAFSAFSQTAVAS